MNDTEAMKAYIDSLGPSEFVQFYRKVKETYAVLYEGQRPDFTIELLGWKEADPARWLKACHLAGIDAQTDARPDPLYAALEATRSLSEDARTIIIHLYEQHRKDPGKLPWYEEISKKLSISVHNVDDSATELKVAGYVNLQPVFGGIERTAVEITDEGRVAAKQLLQRAKQAQEPATSTGTTELHSIVTAGRKNTPNGTQVEISLGTKPEHVKVRMRLPGQASWNTFENLPIANGVVELPMKLVFLCHASEDKPAVESVSNKLTRDGFLTWLDTKDLLPGDDWQQEIEQAIETSDYVLVFLSKTSCSKTGYVQKEIRYALEQRDLRPPLQRYVIPVLLEECEPPRQFHSIHWLRLGEQNWYEKLRLALEQTGGAVRDIEDRTVQVESRSDALLIKMAQTERPAIINAHMQAPRHVVIGGEKFLNEDDDLHRLQFLEAMENLADHGYVDEANDDIFRLTARGLERARRLHS